MKATSVGINKRSGSSSSNADPIQLFRPAHIPSSLQELLERQDLTEDDILSYLSSGHSVPQHRRSTPPPEDIAHQAQLAAYQMKRLEREEGMGQHIMNAGGGGGGGGGTALTTAVDDAHGNIRFATAPPEPIIPAGHLHLPPVAHARPPVAAAAAAPPPLLARPIPPPQPPPWHGPLLGNNNNNHNNNNNINGEDDDNNDLEGIQRQQQELQATETILQALERYRQDEVMDWATVELIDADRRPAPSEQRNNLTVRRICIAVLAVAISFICIMRQAFPVRMPNNNNNRNVGEDGETNNKDKLDKLMYQILNVRHLSDHLSQCGWDRTAPQRPSTILRQWLLWVWPRTMDCSDGVVHIPAQESGVDVSWFIPCQPLPEHTDMGACFPRPVDKNGAATCRKDHDRGNQPNLCFRGIHDSFLTKEELQDTLHLGYNLIAMGGDHFDIHFDPAALEEHLPSVVSKLRLLLMSKYNLPETLVPVAFRVNAAGPMDGESVPLYGLDQSRDHPVVRLLNRTRYIQWMSESMHHNEFVGQYGSSLPWPFRLAMSMAQRDTCNLMPDLRADSRFAVLTSIFLSDGSRDFRGGVSLFVDDGVRWKTRKIRRGLSIDGRAGRLVVSTGGMENLRCRLPVRAGVRASLQIWWNCL